MATKPKAKTKSKKSVAKAEAAAPVDSQYRSSKIYKSPKKVGVDQLPSEYRRADLEFIGVDHSGATYEARVFINNSKADANTQTTEANGYAGSYYVFGHGGCFGDVGHCDVTERLDDFDPRRSHPLETIKKIVVATDAIKRAASQSPELNITVVPVVMSWTEKSDLTDVLKFDHINLITYD